jgi:hypothetical protein
MLPVIAPEGFVRRLLPAVGFLLGISVGALCFGLLVGALRGLFGAVRWAVGRESDADLL